MSGRDPGGDRAERFAAIHAEAFAGPHDAPWSAAAFADLLAQAGVFAAEAADGFILMRAVADEAEILTLAVRPAARRGGLGGRLVGSGAALIAGEVPGAAALDLVGPSPEALARLAAAADPAANPPRPLYLRAPDATPPSRLPGQPRPAPGAI